MDDNPPRPFGAPPNQIERRTSTTNLETAFYTKIGSRVAHITAYYEHLNVEGSRTNNPTGLPEPNYPPPSVPNRVTFSEPKAATNSEILYEIPKSTKFDVRK